MATTSRIVFSAAPLDCGLSELPFQAWPMYLRTRRRGATRCVTGPAPPVGCRGARSTQQPSGASTAHAPVVPGHGGGKQEEDDDGEEAHTGAEAGTWVAGGQGSQVRVLTLCGPSRLGPGGRCAGQGLTHMSQTPGS